MPCENTFEIRKKLIYAGLLCLVIVPVAASQAYANEPHERTDGKAKIEQTVPTATKVQTTDLAMAQPYLGHAPYICTPSGFGERARCFSRARIQSR